VSKVKVAAAMFLIRPKWKWNSKNQLRRTAGRESTVG